MKSKCVRCRPFWRENRRAALHFPYLVISLIPALRVASLDRVLVCMCGVIAFTAVALSITSVSLCEFIEFELPPIMGLKFKPVVFGAWRWKYESFEIVQIGTELYHVVNYDCESMPDSLDMDTKWMSVRVFSILAPLLGTLASISLFKSAKLGAGLFLLTTVFQGLTLLLLKSDLCSFDTNPFLEEFFERDPQLVESYVVDCKVGRSGTISCVATSFFFVAAVLAALHRKEAQEDGRAVLDSKEGGDVAAVGDVAENMVDVPEETDVP